MRKKGNLLGVLIIGFLVSSCGPGQILGPTNTPTPTITATSTSTLTPTEPATLTPTPSQTPTATPACSDAELFFPMSEKQIEYIQSQPYNFLYKSDEQNVENIYSINRADTSCGLKTSEGNIDVWKMVSGFIVDLEQPDEKLYHRGDNETFVNIYVKARFISLDGEAHDYWLKLYGYQPPYWFFNLVQWDQKIAESRDTNEKTAKGIIFTAKNSDGSNSNLDANTMIPDGLLKVNDQFIAVIGAGYFDAEGKFVTHDTTNQFLDAIEGKADFPDAPDGFWLFVRAMIVPAKP